MNTYKSIVQVGCGKMGSIWADAWQESSCELCGIIDPDPPNEAVEQFGSELFYASTTEYMKDNRASQIDILSIATPPEYHTKYLQYGIYKLVPQIIVEKPSTQSIAKAKEINEMAKYSKISVDYIETKHEVLEILGTEIKNNFDLTRALHWRGKEPRNFNPYIRDDLIHDISELQFTYDKLDRNFSNIDVIEADIESWETTDRFESENRAAVDVNANVKLNGAQNESICIRGGFDEPNERRYFIWIDDTREVAYLGNTVNRSDITPVAAKITGEKDIETAYEWCSQGKLTSDTAFSNLFDKINARTFTIEEHNKQVQKISEEICNGKQSPVSFSDAVEIESLAADIYAAGSFTKPE